VLVEGVSVAALEELCEAYLNDAALRRNGAGADIVRDTYTLQITVSAKP
jgi:hypothetical protein